MSPSRNPWSSGARSVAAPPPASASTSAQPAASTRRAPSRPIRARRSRSAADPASSTVRPLPGDRPREAPSRVTGRVDPRRRLRARRVDHRRALAQRVPLLGREVEPLGRRHAVSAALADVGAAAFVVHPGQPRQQAVRGPDRPPRRAHRRAGQVIREGRERLLAIIARLLDAGVDADRVQQPAAALGGGIVGVDLAHDAVRRGGSSPGRPRPPDGRRSSRPGSTRRPARPPGRNRGSRSPSSRSREGVRVEGVAHRDCLGPRPPDRRQAPEQRIGRGHDEPDTRPPPSPRARPCAGPRPRSRAGPSRRAGSRAPAGGPRRRPARRRRGSVRSSRRGHPTR